MSMSSLNQLSEHLLISVKKEAPHLVYLDKISQYPKATLEKELSNDTLKKAFWINIYNSFFQILRKSHNLKQPQIYTSKKMVVAGRKISLDNIEHGILRRFRYKYSLGYLPDLFASKEIRKWAVNSLDFRIHFALNCGAISCPPIAFYSAKKLEKQLDLAGMSFITEETQIDDQVKRIYVSRLFLWFLNDFGGISGIRRLMSDHFSKNFEGYKIIYNKYSWDELLDNYNEDSFQKMQ